jgi:hypothetical protein
MICSLHTLQRTNSHTHTHTHTHLTHSTPSPSTPTGASISTNDTSSASSGPASSCSSQPLEESDLRASLDAALRDRWAAEQRIEEMSNEVLALRVSNHKLMRVFNRDWKRKAMQLEESEAGLQEEVSKLKQQIKQLQEQALASDATTEKASKVTRHAKNR